MTWGYIDKRARNSRHISWQGVEPCSSEQQGKARAAELERADPLYEYIAREFYDLPLFIYKTPAHEPTR